MKTTVLGVKVHWKSVLSGLSGRDITSGRKAFWKDEKAFASA